MKSDNYNDSFADKMVSPRCLLVGFGKPTFTDNKHFYPAHSSIGTIREFGHRNRVHLRDVNDLKGTYSNMPPLHYEGASYAIVTFDMNKIQTFETANSLVEYIREQLGPEIVIALVGTYDQSTKEEFTKPNHLENLKGKAAKLAIPEALVFIISREDEAQFDNVLSSVISSKGETYYERKKREKKQEKLDAGLQRTVQEGNLKNAKWLHKIGANIYARRFDPELGHAKKYTLLTLARLRNHLKVVLWLLKQDVGLDQPHWLSTSISSKFNFLVSVLEQNPYPNENQAILNEIVNFIITDIPGGKLLLPVIIAKARAGSGYCLTNDECYNAAFLADFICHIHENSEKITTVFAEHLLEEIIKEHGHDKLIKLIEIYRKKEIRDNPDLRILLEEVNVIAKQYPIANFFIAMVQHRAGLITDDEAMAQLSSAAVCEDAVESVLVQPLLESIELFVKTISADVEITPSSKPSLDEGPSNPDIQIQREEQEREESEENLGEKLADTIIERFSLAKHFNSDYLNSFRQYLVSIFEKHRYKVQVNSPLKVLFGKESYEDQVKSYLKAFNEPENQPNNEVTNKWKKKLMLRLIDEVILKEYVSRDKKVPYTEVISYIINSIGIKLDIVQQQELVTLESRLLTHMANSTIDDFKEFGKDLDYFFVQNTVEHNDESLAKSLVYHPLVYHRKTVSLKKLEKFFNILVSRITISEDNVDAIKIVLRIIAKYNFLSAFQTLLNQADNLDVSLIGDLLMKYELPMANFNIGLLKKESWRAKKIVQAIQSLPPETITNHRMAAMLLCHGYNPDMGSKFMEEYGQDAFPSEANSTGFLGSFFTRSVNIRLYIKGYIDSVISHIQKTRKISYRDLYIFNNILSGSKAESNTLAGLIMQHAESMQAIKANICKAIFCGKQKLDLTLFPSLNSLLGANKENQLDLLKLAPKSEEVQNDSSSSSESDTDLEGEDDCIPDPNFWNTQGQEMVELSFNEEQHHNPSKTPNSS